MQCCAIPLIKDCKVCRSAISKHLFARKDLLETTICLSNIATLKNGYAFQSGKYNALGKWKILTITNVSGERYINDEDYNCIINLPNDIQDHQVLKEGDIVNVDVSTIYQGYFSDSSRMFCIGEVSPEMQRLVQVTKECRDLGIQAARPWARLGDVGAAIQEHAEKNGYSVVRDLCGHGVGVKFHEEPDVEHFGKRGTGMLIVPGMTFTIEPMINMGTYDVFIDEADGWTVCTDDGLPSAQWESMILITEDGNEILTQ